MKCEGAENPPCKRCEKVGRECLPQGARAKDSDNLHGSPHRSKDSSLASRHPERPRKTNASLARNHTQPTVLPSAHTPASTTTLSLQKASTPYTNPPVSRLRMNPSDLDSRSELPSIYSTPPVETVNESTPYPPSPSMAVSVPRKRKRHATVVGSDIMSPGSFCTGEILIPKDDIKEMIQL